MAFHDHFSEVARHYADFRPRYPQALFDFLATLVPASGVVWDCAAGNGQATVDLASRFDHVIATDASREQIGSAKPHPKIEFRVAPAEDSGLAGQSVELITVAQAFHWFDQERFHAEARRVLKHAGVLAIWAYGVNVVEGDSVVPLVQEYYERTVGPYWPPERKLVEEGYRHILFPYEPIPAPNIPMEARWNLEQLIGYFSTWSATNRCAKATGRNPIEPLSKALAGVWGDPKSTRLVTWPLTIRVGCLRRW